MQIFSTPFFDRLSKSGLLILIPILVYLVGVLPNLHLPGTYYDEVLQVLPAMQAAGYDLTPDYLMIPGSVMGVGDFRIPLMTTSYLGSLETMLMVPLFLIFEPTVLTLRLFFVALGLLSIVLTFIWSRQVLGPWGALLVTLLLATNASYIMFTRVDNGPVNTMMLIKLGMLIAFTHWWRTGRAISFLIGMFLMGLGVYDKANFAWLIAAGFITLLIFAPLATWKRLYGRWGMLAAGVFAAVLGALPFLGYIAITGGGPFRSFLGTSESSTVFGVDNTNYLGNLAFRVRDFGELMAGYKPLNEYLTSFTGYHVDYAPFPLNFQPWLLVAAVVAPMILYLVWRKPADDRLRLSLALAVLIAGILVFSILTPTTLSSHHLVIVHPFPELLVANSALIFFSDPQRRSRLLEVLAAGVIGLQLLFQVGVLARNHQVLVETEGAGMWSAAIYDLNSYLLDQGKPVICLDWGFCHNLQFLSQGRLKTSDLWNTFLGPREDTSAMETLLVEDHIFLFHAPNYTGALSITDEDYARQTFFAAAEKLNLEIEGHTIYQANGDAVYEVFQIAS